MQIKETKSIPSFSLEYEYVLHEDVNFSDLKTSIRQFKPVENEMKNLYSFEIKAWRFSWGISFILGNIILIFRPQAQDKGLYNVVIKRSGERTLFLIAFLIAVVCGTFALYLGMALFNILIFLASFYVIGLVQTHLPLNPSYFKLVKFLGRYGNLTLKKN